jgi:predicted ATPase with chaperone activity
MPLARARTAIRNSRKDWPGELVTLALSPAALPKGGSGRPRTQIDGLPDASLNEAEERVRAAIRNSREEWPGELVRLALSPAALPKGGSGYDLVPACAVPVPAPARVRGAVRLLRGGGVFRCR